MSGRERVRLLYEMKRSRLARRLASISASADDVSGLSVTSLQSSLRYSSPKENLNNGNYDDDDRLTSTPNSTKSGTLHLENPGRHSSRRERTKNFLNYHRSNFRDRESNYMYNYNTYDEDDDNLSKRLDFDVVLNKDAIAAATAIDETKSIRRFSKHTGDNGELNNAWQWHDVSAISLSSDEKLREQLSTSSLCYADSGAMHSTFCYPLHSTRSHLPTVKEHESTTTNEVQQLQYPPPILCREHGLHPTFGGPCIFQSDEDSFIFLNTSLSDNDTSIVDESSPTKCSNIIVGSTLPTDDSSNLTMDETIKECNASSTLVISTSNDSPESNHSLQVPVNSPNVTDSGGSSSRQNTDAYDYVEVPIPKVANIYPHPSALLRSVRRRQRVVHSAPSATGSGRVGSPDSASHWSAQLPLHDGDSGFSTHSGSWRLRTYDAQPRRIVIGCESIQPANANLLLPQRQLQQQHQPQQQPEQPQQQPTIGTSLRTLPKDRKKAIARKLKKFRNIFYDNNNSDKKIRTLGHF